MNSAQPITKKLNCRGSERRLPYIWASNCQVTSTMVKFNCIMQTTINNHSLDLSQYSRALLNIQLTSLVKLQVETTNKHLNANSWSHIGQLLSLSQSSGLLTSLLRKVGGYNPSCWKYTLSYWKYGLTLGVTKKENEFHRLAKYWFFPLQTNKNPERLYSLVYQ